MLVDSQVRLLELVRLWHCSHYTMLEMPGWFVNSIVSQPSHVPSAKVHWLHVLGLIYHFAPCLGWLAMAICLVWVLLDYLLASMLARDLPVGLLAQHAICRVLMSRQELRYKDNIGIASIAPPASIS